MPRFATLLGPAVLIAVATAAAAEGPAPLPQPDGEVLLTVTGDLALTNGDDEARFDLAMLREVGEATITTSTIWTEGVHTFTGVPLAALMERLGVEDGHLTLMALNDYSVDFPVSEAGPDGPIVAYEMDGREMSVRDKGPLWIIYPYDDNPDYRSETAYSRSIWQLDRMVVASGS